MAFTPKSWQNSPVTTTPLSAAAMIDLETRLSAYTDLSTGIPEYYGAVGDGVTDDTAALQSWLTSGKNLQMTPGKTYLFRQSLKDLTAGQNINGRGATLKPVNQAQTTTTTTVTANTTNQIVAASASGFQVNDQIFLSQGTTYTNLHTISAINSNTITISDTFDVSFSGTTTVSLGLYQFFVDADDVDLSNIVFDGNSANWPTAFWAVTLCVFIGTGYKNSRVHHCWFKNQPGDGCVTNNAVGATIAFNRFESIGGRGFSYGGDSAGSDVGNRCLYNYFHNIETNSNVYLSPGGAGPDGHGAINFSGGGLDCITHGNIIDTAIEGIGNWRLLFGTNPGGHQFTHNIIKNTTSYGFSGEGIGGSTAAIRTIIASNQFYSTGGIAILGSSSGPTFSHSWIVKDNICWESPIDITCVDRFIIQGNHVGSAGTTNILLFLDNGGSPFHGVTETSVSGNLFYGGLDGVRIASTATQIRVESNIFTGQYHYGVNSLATDASIVVANNTIQATSASSTSGTTYAGIIATGKNQLINNDIDTSVANGIDGFGVQAGGTGVRLQGNRVRRGSQVGESGYVTSGATGTVFLDNIFDTTFSDSGTGTIKANNYLNFNSGGARSGTATLNGTTGVTVSTGEILTNDNVLVTRQTVSGTAGNIRAPVSISNKTSFAIVSDQATDAGVVYWEIRH